MLTTYGKAGLGRNKAASIGKIASAVVFFFFFSFFFLVFYFFNFKITKPLGFCPENHLRKGD